MSGPGHDTAGGHEEVQLADLSEVPSGGGEGVGVSEHVVSLRSAILLWLWRAESGFGDQGGVV